MVVCTVTASPIARAAATGYSAHSSFFSDGPNVGQLLQGIEAVATFVAPAGQGSADRFRGRLDVGLSLRARTASTVSVLAYTQQ